jgi:hypothetical protein
VIDAVAVYAAAVATASVAWQAYSWRGDRALKVTLDVDLADTVIGSGETVLLITLTNNSAFPVHWTQAEVELQDESGRHVRVGFDKDLPAEFKLPVNVPSRDARHAAIAAASLVGVGFDFDRPVTVKARIATGQWFRSQPKLLATS